LGFRPPEGFFYRVDGRLKSLNLSGIVSKCGGVICLGKDYKKEIINRFINEIKQNPQDWKIRRTKPEETIYGTHQVVEHKSGRKHYKPDFSQIASFSDEEWAEIESALNNQKPAKKENNLTTNQPSSLPNNHKNIYYRVGLISLVLLVVSMIIVWLKKKK